MELAAKHGVDFLLFPELSLTGYEPSLARELAQAPDAEILQPLRELARLIGNDNCRWAAAAPTW